VFLTETNQKLNRRFSALQGSFFSMYAGTSLFSYILLQKGVPTVYMGVLGALTSCSSTLVQPLWGILCDKYRCHRFFYLLSALAAPLIYLWIIGSGSILELVICSLLSGMFVNCIQNMGNGWVSSLNAEGRQINYSASRSFGSLAFAIMAALLGRAVHHWGYAGLIGGMSLCAVFCAVVAFTIPKSRRMIETPATREKSPDEPTLREGLNILLRQREYMAVVFSGFFAMFGIAGISSYLSAHLSAMGAGATAIGLGNFSYAIAEVPFMFLYKRLANRFSFRTLFITCLLAHSLQCILVGISPNYVCAIFAMLLQGPAFGLLVPCLQQYTATHIEARYMSTAQLFTSSVSLSASMIFGSLVAGVLSQFFSLPTTFLLLAAISAVGVVLYGVCTIFSRRSKT